MFLIRKKPVQAKMVGDTLVASFRASNPPLIWKFDLERNHSFTLAMQGEEGDLELGITSPKGEFYPVARFGTQEDADEAFTAVQKILMKGGRGRIKTFVIWLAGLILLAIILVVGGHYITDALSGAKFGAASSFSAQKPPEGVPLPADQVLKAP